MADVTLSAFAGIRNTLPAERLRSTPGRDSAALDLTAADNVLIDNSGQLARREGQTLKVAGAAHSLWAQGDMCLYVQGSTLKRLYPDYSSETLTSGLTADRPMAYVEVAGRIYWSNGEQTGLIADGSCRSWGMPAAPAPGLSAIGGFLAAGSYQAAITWLRSDGQESGCGLSSVIALAGNAGVRVTWAIPDDPGIEQVAIYLSEPDGMTLYQAALADVADGYAEITSGGSALPLATQWHDQPPAGQALAWHRGRIFIAAGAFLFATTALGYEWVDLRDYLALDGSTIRFVIGVEHGLWVATEQRLYFLAGDRLEELSLRPLMDCAGIAGSAVMVDGERATGNAQLAGVRCALFATSAGICLGTPEGQLLNLSAERYRFEATAVGAGRFRDDALFNHYLLFLRA